MIPRRLFSLLFTAVVASSAASLPYQGILTDEKGMPVPDGDKAMVFAVYGQSTGGSALWTEPRTVTTRKGLFSLSLGAATPLPDSLFARDSLFLNVTVSGTDQVPRTPLGASPWAFRAHKADTAQFAKNVPGLGAKVDTSAITSRLAGYATTASLNNYATTSSLSNYVTSSTLSNYVAFPAMAMALGGKVDTAALATRLSGYAATTALAGYAKSTDLAGYATTTDLAGYAKSTDLAGYATTTALAGYAKSTDLAGYATTTTLAGYAKTTALAAYATTAAVNAKMATADYVESGHLRALGGIVGGRGQSQFIGSEIRLDTTGLVASAGAKAVRLTHEGLTWGNGYDEWRFLAIPGGALSLIMGNRSFDMTMLSFTTSGAQFPNDVKIDGALTLKTAAAVVPDYVFEPDYKLAPLSEVEAFIQANKHLPEVPSAKEIEAGGMDLAQMNLLLLKKVEELTLHVIAQEKEMQAMKERLK